MPTTTAILQACQHVSGLLQGFIAILEQERQLLDEPVPAAALDALTARKSCHADLLLDADKARRALLVQAGYPDSPDALEAAASDFPALSAPISELMALAGRANALNTENGVTITTYLAHGRQALQDLQRLAGADALYDARGRRPGGPACSFTGRG